MTRNVLKSLILLLLGATMISASDKSTFAQRHMEQLDRGLIAIERDDRSVYVGWRLFGTDPPTAAFNLYRDGTRVNRQPITNSTNFIDRAPQTDAMYTVRPIIDGHELDSSKPATVQTNGYFNIPLQTPDGYTPNDASVGDLDGDGQYDIVLHQTSRGRDNSQAGLTNPPIIEAYQLDGTMLWRINLGRNIREGAHYTQMIVYDLDSDGYAEFACKTADGTVDGLGHTIGDPDANWVNRDGKILNGPEFFSIFDGRTGRVLTTVDYIPDRGDIGGWGGVGGNGGNDRSGNRVDRFLACVAYLDGVRPSVVMCRGYYGRSVLAAWDWRDSALTSFWVFDSAKLGLQQYSGQGNHSVSVADVDDDGKDEIIYGAMAVDDDGTGLYSTGLRHGDALHVGDLDPSRPGLEVWGIHENETATTGLGTALFNARTGEIYWGGDEGSDVGRGLAADIDPNHPGCEFWGGSDGLLNCNGQPIAGIRPSSTNFAIWWDGDLLRELLNSNRIDKPGVGRLLTADGCTSNNGSKSTPALSADILGDWREEVIFRTKDNQNLRIYTTTIPTNHRLPTLMHNPQYRTSIASQNVAYNQPPHPSFFLGHGMKEPPRPEIITIDPKKPKHNLKSRPL